MSEQLLPYKILFIEDEVETRQNYTVYLKTLFEEVYEAGDGQEALELYKKIKPDIMIIDINLPKMNGLEFLTKVRETDHSTKAIMLTAHTDKSFLLEATALKLTRYLVKPVNRRDLKKAIQITLEELGNYKVTTVKKIVIDENNFWDTTKKEFFHFNKIVTLTSNEKKLLELLLSHKDKVFSYDEIFEYFWEEDAFTLNSLKNLIKRLRKKLPVDIISNVFNQGYKISF
jgi:DNA-binding response OmpR family regulator